MEEKGEIIHSSFWSNFFNSPSKKNDLLEALKSIPVFSEFTKKELASLAGFVHERTYLAGEYVFYQGDPGIGLYIVIEGEVIIQRNVESKLISLATFSKNDFFGELALIDGEKRSASAIAKTDLSVAVIFKPDLDEFIDTHPKKGIKILKGINHLLTMRLRKLNEDHIALHSKLLINMEKDHGT
ncbi:MAG: cyclic nucleotide-binding domain-containing protein [Ignavibacteriales bacterium]|nr:MAG: cyclic nucleotide-binding domain-containing protein [Ignavibacteriales bacterium]